ncbi:MAG: hypothetical protein IJY60_05700, partial [Bacteroides sp.]|nr:hypothetical protein [Bacteroides sp.]
MKKLLILALSLLIGGLGCYANTLQDTIIVVKNPNQVTIEKTRNSMSVKVEGSADNPDYYYLQKMEVDSTAAVITEEKNADWDFTIPFIGKKKENRKSRMNLCVGGFGFGMVNAIDAPDDMNVDMGASYELMWDNMLKLNYYVVPNTTSISMGFGMTWRNYRMTGRTRFIQKGDNLLLGSYPEGAEIKFSRLKVFSLTVPFMINQSLGRNVVLSVGPVINFNTHASLKTRYALNGEKVKEKSNDIHHSKMTIDLMAKLRFKSIGVYA